MFSTSNVGLEVLEVLPLSMFAKVWSTWGFGRAGEVFDGARRWGELEVMPMRNSSTESVGRCRCWAALEAKRDVRPVGAPGTCLL